MTKRRTWCTCLPKAKPFPASAQLAALDQRNPITASRLAKTLSRWRSYGPQRSESMRQALQQLADAPLSTNTREVVEQCLDSSEDLDSSKGLD